MTPLESIRIGSIILKIYFSIIGKTRTLSHFLYDKIARLRKASRAILSVR